MTVPRDIEESRQAACRGVLTLPYPNRSTSQVTTEPRSRADVSIARPARGQESGLGKPTAPFGVATLIGLAICLGLATGLIELATLYVRWRLLDATAAVPSS